MVKCKVCQLFEVVRESAWFYQAVIEFIRSKIGSGSILEEVLLPMVAQGTESVAAIAETALDSLQNLGNERRLLLELAQI